MPSWTAENDLKLASAIIALHQVKVSKDDCERLARIIGDDCTAKAITHRVAKFREAATKLGLTGDGDAAAAAPATPATGKKRARKTKGDEDQDVEGVLATPTKKPRTPKTKKSSAVVKDDVKQEEERVEEEPLDEEQLQADA
ncbi:hypothetical protein GJ744_009749 [Endocarpon pusillum]|uniref:Uncharacterized protein n=1 Tax=Endocarpon pusillum TaxID=364733 RepID=A0A8H7E9L4_9EURO|nr:hypothetical protein GJ744_009749 [Endocarpon pusillum]